MNRYTLRGLAAVALMTLAATLGYATPTQTGTIVSLDMRRSALRIGLAASPGGRVDMIVNLRLTSRPSITDAAGDPMRATDLAEGMRVEAGYDGMVYETFPPQIEAHALRVLPGAPAAPDPTATVRGYVQAVHRQALATSARIGGPVDLTMDFGPRTPIFRADGSRGYLWDIRPGTLVEATYDGRILESLPPRIHARSLHIQAP